VRRLKSILFTTAALTAAVVVFVGVTLPAARIRLAEANDGTIAGILHVHTNRSDGLAAPGIVAAAAARAGLKFIVFTDHGDATRTPDAPTYRDGVLCLDGVEISTSGGHYAAFDMPQSPYPLAGEPRDVAEDVRRLGGFGIVAHPDSPKAQLAWTDWTVRFDGIELLNPDTSWRILAAAPGWAARGTLFAALLDYPFRAPEVMANLLQPTDALARWEAVARTRRVVTLAGADAHARLALRNNDPGDGGFALPIPGYEASFNVLSVHVRTDRPLTGNAVADAAVVIRAIRNGHLYTAVDGLASPPSFAFTGANSLGMVREGDSLGVGGPVQLHVTSNAPPGFVTVVRDGTRILSSVRDAQDLTVHGSDSSGVYWSEIVDTNRTPSIVWIRSNPIYVRSTADILVPAAPAPVLIASDPIFDGASLDGWTVEHDNQSVAAVDIVGEDAGVELRYRYGLADRPAAGQYTSLVRNVPAGVQAFDRLSFTARAERPMRLSLQIRDTTADRWQRSLYVDTTSRDRTVMFSDVRPVGVTHAARPMSTDFRSILFVVDTTNTKPGSSGRIWISNVRLER
jgi:hypothetical protein